jgi:FeS assembly SUF system protein
MSETGRLDARGEERDVGEEPRPKQAIEQDVIDVLKTVYDPEIPVNIYELGLIYDIDVRDDRSVAVRLTLTSPMCPVAGSLPPEVEAKVAQVEGVTQSIVDLVWDPPWNPGMMSEAAKLELGFL